MSKVLEALISIQGELKSPKDQKTNKYRYRNIEAVNEAVKPLAEKHGCAVVYSDSPIEINGNLFCQATCRLLGEDGEICATALSLIETKPQYMSKEQSTGAASSYARKYAACGLFAIDDSVNDPDKTNASSNTSATQRAPKVSIVAKQKLGEACTKYAEFTGSTVEEVKSSVMKRQDFKNTTECYLRIADELASEVVQ